MFDSSQNDEVVEFFGRHIVALSCDYIRSDNNERQTPVISGFIMSIRNVWFFITAGHVLEKFENAVKEGGCFREWELFDGFGAGARDRRRFRFDYDSAPKQWWHVENEGIDYGVGHLRPYYQNLLQANGIEPITEQAWTQNVPDEFDAYYLAGIPEEGIAVHAHTGQIGSDLRLLNLLPTDNPPDALKKPFPRLYFQLQDSDAMNVPQSVKGMSGGPVFGFKRGEDSRLRYWVVAVQSGWSRSDRVIAACPIKVFGEWVSEQLAELEKQVQEEIENDAAD